MEIQCVRLITCISFVRKFRKEETEGLRVIKNGRYILLTGIF